MSPVFDQMLFAFCTIEFDRALVDVDHLNHAEQPLDLVRVLAKMGFEITYTLLAQLIQTCGNLSDVLANQHDGRVLKEIPISLCVLQEHPLGLFFLCFVSVAGCQIAAGQLGYVVLSIEGEVVVSIKAEGVMLGFSALPHPSESIEESKLSDSGEDLGHPFSNHIVSSGAIKGLGSRIVVDKNKVFAVVECLVDSDPIGRVLEELLVFIVTHFIPPHPSYYYPNFEISKTRCCQARL